MKTKTKTKTFQSLCLAKVRVMNIFKYPYRESHTVRNWDFCQQPAPISCSCAWVILEVDPPAIVKASDDGSTGQPS